MKQRHLLMVAAFFLTHPVTAGEAHSPAPGVYDLPLTFEKNRGQVDDRFDYVARAPGYTLYLSAEEVLFGVHGSDGDFRPGALGMRLIGALPDAATEALEPAVTKTHYYVGSDPARWLKDVPNFKRILYNNVYPGVDISFYGNPQQVEYDFIVSPGASWEQIRLRFEGAEDISLAPDGRLVLKLRDGEFVQPPPVIYQERVDGTRELIEGSFVLAGAGEVAFQVGSYDPSRPLVIDPIILLYLGYLGGFTSPASLDDPTDIATDSTGAAYVVGQTTSTDFPATITTWESSVTEAYVVKINPQGDGIVWAVVFGGSFDDQAYAVAVDSSEQVYFCGETESTDLPTANAYQSTREFAPDIFVAMLSSTATSLVYSSYLGGDSNVGFAFPSETCRGIDVDNGLIYIAGATNTDDFDTTTGAYDETGPVGSGCYEDNRDAFISVFDPTLSGAATLVYSTYLGSEMGDDIINDLAVIAPGEVAVTGSTAVVVASGPNRRPAGCTNLPFPTTTDAFQTTFQGSNFDTDAIVTRLDTTAIPASALVYSTFYGSDSFDEGRSIDVLSDDAFVLGQTFASDPDFPTTSGVFQTSNNGSGELFIGRFDTSGAGPGPGIAPQGVVSTLIYSTLYGGSDNENPGGIAVNSSGEAHILADTTSSDISVPNAFDATFDGDQESGDLVVAQVSSDATTLDFASYLGGTDDEGATGSIALAPNGDMLIAAASSTSSGLATTGSFDESLAGGRDGIVARIGEEADLDLTVMDSPDPVLAGANLTYDITVDNLGDSDATNTTLTVSISQSTFVSSTGSCVDNTGDITCDVGTLLAPGGPGPAPAGSTSASFNIVIQVDPYFDGSSMLHTFDVSADQFDTDLTNNSVSVDTLVEFDADLEVTKTDSADPVTQGDMFDYEVTVTNNGPSGASSVSLVDTIPSEVSFESSVPAGKTCFFSQPKGSDPEVDCFFGDLDPGASAMVTITVTAGAGPATATNMATASDFTDDSDASNDSVDEETTILGQPDLTVSVTDSPDPVTAGENLTYNVSVMNGGTAEAPGSVLDVTLDNGLSFVSGSVPAPSGTSLQGTTVCTPSGNMVSCTLGAIAAQGSVPVSIVATVSSAQTARASPASSTSPPRAMNRTIRTTTTLRRPGSRPRPISP